VKCKLTILLLNVDVTAFPQTVLDFASEYVDTVAWHCYADPLDWSVLTDFKNSNPNVTQYMTECWTPSFGEWYQASSFTIGPLQNWASGVMAWTLGTNSSDGPSLTTGGCSDCTGLVVINDDGTYTLQTAYYMLAQYSAFIPSGATLLDGSGSWTFADGGIESVASLNPDGTRTVVIQNTFPADVYVNLKTTSGEEWSGDIPKESVVTWVLPEAS
jgi:glucan endo-1,6-beta-glucosidase